MIFTFKLRALIFHLITDTMNARPDTSAPVNEKEEYCTVLKGRLQNHSILFSAEVDGEDPSYYATAGCNPSSTKCYVELKTSRIIQNERQNQSFLRLAFIKIVLYIVHQSIIHCN